MAFPATTLRLAPTLDQIAAIMRGVRSFALERQAAMSANVKANSVIDIWERMKISKSQLGTLAATPGLSAYAQGQYDDNTLDIVAEYQAVIAAIDAVTANIESTFPKDGSGYLLAAQFNGGALVYREFTPAQLTTLAGLLGTLAGMIN